MNGRQLFDRFALIFYIAALAFGLIAGTFFSGPN